MLNDPRNLVDVLAWISKIESLWLTGVTTLPTKTHLMRLLLADSNRYGMRSSHVDLPGFTSMLARFKAEREFDPNFRLSSDASEEPVQAADIWNTLADRCAHRRVAISKYGHRLLVPKLTAVGDLIVELNGGHYPFILRSRDSEFLLIGACYIDGGMPWQEQEYAEFKKDVQERPGRIFNIV